ncbi:hypothetical protein [Calothrix sp. PCC 7507]|uniref:hypothetical protein n=1 Tax=Calothrix sp. PCC 7507 TaxID=99598 RepID=UPI00029F3986|nr:hypothetical protein [Calothrix sp. PCC 7507]AFY31298.1 hypothetical protein Cal7507_0814 [Calothrix sp. PCC 7507]
MPKTSQLDVIMQQLDNLSVEELLAVRAKVDALIEGKSSLLLKILSFGSYTMPTTVSSDIRDIDVASVLTSEIPGSSIRGLLRSAIISGNLGHNNLQAYQVVQFFKLAVKEDDSLEKVIELVDEWIADESGYDEEIYPQIETALN